MINRDTKKKDNKPDTKKKDDKPDTKKKDNKPDTEPKDDKSDTSKNNVENRVSNRIKYEIQDIAKYRKVLIEMIDKRIDMLDLMYLWLTKSIYYIGVYDNMPKFIGLCDGSGIDFIERYMLAISRIYAINVALDCLRDGVGNGIWPKGVSYNLISIINEESVENYYEIIALEKTMLIKAAYEEIEMLRRLIMANIHKYKNIIKGA